MKKFLKVFLFILLVLIVVAWVTGKLYLFKTIAYNFPNIDDINIFEKREIKTGTAQEWPLSAEYNKTELPKEVNDLNVADETVEFLIVRHDSIVYEQYWDGYDKSSISNSFSVAKSIVGLLTGIAESEGKLSLQDPVGKYIPAFNTPENSSLKIINLINMTSGLNWDETYSDPFSKTTEAYYGSELEKQMSTLKVIKTPGSELSYKSCNTMILSMVVARATGKTISEYASEKLWKPLGATNNAYWSLDHSDGIEKGYCCFYSTARDFARIGQLMLDTGKWKGKQLVPREFAIQSITPNMIPDESGQPTDYYGLHWWLTNIDNHPIYYARGILGQYIICIPDEDIVVVRLGKKRGTKVAGNRYSDMVEYTIGAISAYGK